jgi:hypothetical protein
MRTTIHRTWVECSDGCSGDHLSTQPDDEKFLPREDVGPAAPAYREVMARTDDFRIAPGDGLRYYAPEPDRERQDREGGYLVLLAVVVLVLVAMATGQVTVFYY